MDCLRRRPASGLISHCDRSSQYYRQDFRDRLQAWAQRNSNVMQGQLLGQRITESLWN